MSLSWPMGLSLRTRALPASPMKRLPSASRTHRCLARRRARGRQRCAPNGSGVVPVGQAATSGAGMGGRVVRGAFRRSILQLLPPCGRAPDRPRDGFMAGGNRFGGCWVDIGLVRRWPGPKCPKTCSFQIGHKNAKSFRHQASERKTFLGLGSPGVVQTMHCCLSTLSWTLSTSKKNRQPLLAPPTPLPLAEGVGQPGHLG